MISLPHGSVNEANCYCLTHLGGAGVIANHGAPKECPRSINETLTTRLEFHEVKMIETVDSTTSDKTSRKGGLVEFY